ncbi:ABC transporter ATP-binding protein [Microvirga rosea]|uniref:ABC transporter ATP-binding protein n=1 Tax=Microvirga rosea TaxID=2715425 RepID=UPI001D0AA607|nr:oligopeptide/dipeptide ABC transporter ATP-binding protein [Microvirga rosea]MCB8822488.1 ATP-binding cassette domain-containing protein [Microvirga rosea]
MLIEPLLEIRDVSKTFPQPRTLLEVLARQPKRTLHALRGVSLMLRPGETLGIVGESGCGKSTLGRCLAGLHTPEGGEILWRRQPLSDIRRADRSRRIQMVFQDPYSSLNPRMTIAQMLDEVLFVHAPSMSSAERRDRTDSLLQMVGLSPGLKNRLPHAFSGGQRQRISIARALALEPEVLVADEPVSALDVSVQAQIINLLESLREKLGISIIFIAHDLNVVRHISHRVAVMYLGQIVETAATETLFGNPQHPYTQALLSAIPVPDPDIRSLQVGVQGELPDPLSPPPGCGFSTRCPFVMDKCEKPIPEFFDSGGEHHVRCIRAHSSTFSVPA